jgi:uncharacterized protein YeaO (DUF488 family)
LTTTPTIGIARAYDDLTGFSGGRLLVDRIWPRGLRKADLRLDDWIREVAPSGDLRKWFGHDPDKWDGFGDRYRAELDGNTQAVARCLVWCQKGPVVLLYGAKDRDRNQAVILRDYLGERLARENAT